MDHSLIVEISVDALSPGDVLIHKQGDGRYGLYGIEDVTDDRLFYRYADSLETAASAARAMLPSGRLLWYSDWTTPDRQSRY